MSVFIVFSLVIWLFSIVIHEIAHGSVALYLGDATAKTEGRLSLNPLKHLDPFGSVILPFLLFISGSPILIGWAKPVPINPYNFRDQRWGALKVAFAGPAANFLLALVFGLFLRFVNLSQAIPFMQLLEVVVFYNIFLGLFNLVPLPPLDGSHVLFSFLTKKWLNLKVFLYQYGIIILVFFMFFGTGALFSLASFFYYLITGERPIL
jgi:Zn-dependent protease